MAKKVNLKPKTKKFLKKIESLGYHVQDIKFSNRLYNEGYDDNMICSFKVKEIKGWLFGIWWWYANDETEDEFKYDFFGQFEKTIDKFKPSASVFVERDVFEDGIIFWAEDILKFIKKHPYRAYYMDNHWSVRIYDDIPCGLKLWWNYFYDWHILESIQKINEKRYTKKYISIIKDLASRELTNWKIVDQHRSDYIVWPRYWVVAKNFKHEKVEEKGCYSLYKKGIYPKLDKKVAKFDKKYEKLRKSRYINWECGLEPISSASVTIYVKKVKKNS